MSAAVAHARRSMPAIDPVAGHVSAASRPGDSAEITAAITQIMSSLEDLAGKCRNQGLDPMTMIMKMISSGAQGGGAAPGLAAIPPPIGVAAQLSSPPSDAELIANSHNLIEALNRGDVATAAAVLAPGFVRFAGGTVIDRDALLLMTMQQRSNAPEIAMRTWDKETVVHKDDAIVFTGKAREVQAGNDTKGGYLHDGWYLLQWVRAGDVWQVQLLTWQTELTERDRFNDIFLKGRGFSLDPNRLLVETVKDEKPGSALDLAIGQGRNALHLAAHGWKVTGVDSSEEGLRIAREHAVKRELVLETISADIDEWNFGESRFDLVTLIYAGDHARWIDKIKASLRTGGLLVVEGWAKETPDSSVGFVENQLAELLGGYEILLDEVVEDVPDWAWDKGKLVRFVARKR